MTVIKPCHRANLVTNWKCQNKTRTLTLPTQSQDMSLIENLWCKISENNLGDSYMYETSDNQTEVDRVAHPSLEPVSHPRDVHLDRQAVHSRFSVNIHEPTENEARNHSSWKLPARMVSCCVPMCSNSHRNVKKSDYFLTFHYFPKDKNLKKKWMAKIRRDEGRYFKVSCY